MAAPQALRESVARINAAAQADLAAVFASIGSVDEASQALGDTVPSVIARYGAASALSAAFWYEASRQAAGVAGDFAALPADLGAQGADALAQWGASLLVGDPDSFSTRLLTVQVRVGGGVQRRIANYSRQTVIDNSLVDDRAGGWQRVTDGNACAFCTMLAARGAVYSEKTVLFASHDDCGCFAVPAWGGQPIQVNDFTPTQRRISEPTRKANTARVRAWIKAHPNAG